MNDECLKLRDHTAGYQTVEDIQAVVGEAIGLHKQPMADDDYIDEAMVPPPNPATPNIKNLRDIQAVVGEAIGLHNKPLADDNYIDEAMMPPQPCNPQHKKPNGHPGGGRRGH